MFVENNLVINSLMKYSSCGRTSICALSFLHQVIVDQHLLVFSQAAAFIPNPNLTFAPQTPLKTVTVLDTLTSVRTPRLPSVSVSASSLPSGQWDGARSSSAEVSSVGRARTSSRASRASVAPGSQQEESLSAHAQAEDLASYLAPRKLNSEDKSSQERPFGRVMRVPFP